MKLTGGEALVKQLELEGVTQIFGIPGIGRRSELTDVGSLRGASGGVSSGRAGRSKSQCEDEDTE